MVQKYASKTEQRANYSTAFKAKVAAEYLSGKSTGAMIAEKYNIRRGMVYGWGKRVREAIEDKRSAGREDWAD